MKKKTGGTESFLNRCIRKKSQWDEYVTPCVFHCVHHVCVCVRERESELPPSVFLPSFKRSCVHHPSSFCFTILRLYIDVCVYHHF
mmetsp:Transcript_52727/g.78585  ORF Transcript_52727/g.78585 Transcript_52727/m.78585 type:complete len:86 (-) Transcript_52727:338-595(-)